MDLECFIPLNRDSIPVNTSSSVCQNKYTRGKCDLKIKNVSQRRREYYNSKLLDAAKKGNLETCKSLIQDGSADVNSQCRMNGATPIIVATAWGHSKLVQELATLGADVMIRDFKNRTAVHIAAASGFLAILKILLDGSNDNGKKEQLELLVNMPITGKVNVLKTCSFDSWVHKHAELLPPQAGALIN